MVLTAADARGPRAVTSRVCAGTEEIAHHHRYGPGPHALLPAGNPACTARSHHRLRYLQQPPPALLSLEQGRRRLHLDL
jgi:hypothetical protein